MRVVPKAVIDSASEPRARFQALRRLHRPREFSAVLSARKSIKGESFDLHVLETRSPALARLGLIVPKRLARAASLRNAIKRQGREAFRLMAVPSVGFDVVLRLKRPVSAIKKANLRQQLKNWRGEIDSLLDRFAVPGK